MKLCILPWHITNQTNDRNLKHLMTKEFKKLGTYKQVWQISSSPRGSLGQESSELRQPLRQIIMASIQEWVWRGLLCNHSEIRCLYYISCTGDAECRNNGGGNIVHSMQPYKLATGEGLADCRANVWRQPCNHIYDRTCSEYICLNKVAVICARGWHH